MKKLGLIGQSLTHSFSKSYFTEKFQKEGFTDYSYENFELATIQEFHKLLQDETNLIGCNVTIPYKEQICDLLDELDPVAKKLSAVNTVIIDPITKKTKGYNTDVHGFAQSIKPFFNLHHERAFILGTGGSANAVSHALRNLGVQVLFVSRTPKGHNQVSNDDLNQYAMKSHSMIVNCTPLGMFPDIESCPAIPYEFITEKHFLVDLTYNPEETLFLRKGKTQNAMVLNGKDMLVFQAEKSWSLWQDEITKNY